MQGFFDSFGPLFSRFKGEIVLLSISTVICIVSVVVFFQQQYTQDSDRVNEVKVETRTSALKKQIIVDVSGAVKRPFVYSFPVNVRIIDVLQKAGGLTPDADEEFIRRNVNYARKVNDQEKIYFPFVADITEGFVMENKRIIDYTLPNNAIGQDASERININSASPLELDQLPGIGKVQSESIVNGRPYNELNDLVKNNVIKQSVYDKIKDQISIY